MMATIRRCWRIAQLETQMQHATGRYPWWYPPLACAELAIRRWLVEVSR